MMKSATTNRVAILMLMAFLTAAILTSCVKEAGHVIGISVVKSGSLQFYVQGDTTHTLATTADTVLFSSNTAPFTSVTAKNGQKTTSCLFQFNGDTKGTYNLTSLSVMFRQKSGVILTTTSTNSGTVTVDSINATKGYIAGSFTGKVLIAAADTANVTGIFSIQQ